jgi:hypothetical protein
MERSLLDELNSIEYNGSLKSLKEILSIRSLSDVDLLEILNNANRLIIADFLQQFSSFSESNLDVIERYINENLDHDDRLYVSDLIEFATDRNLDLLYSKCLKLLSIYEGDNTYVQLASIEYVLKNLKFEFIREIYDSLSSILDNPECNQSNQVLSSFALLRITNSNKFLVDLVDLVVNGDPNNKEFLNNLLLLDYNSEEYFEHYNILKSLLPHKD